MKHRVKIPVSNPLEVVALAQRVQAKHTLDGDATLLKEINWPVVIKAIDEALMHHNDAEQMRREMLEMYQLREQKLAIVKGFVRDSRDILRRKYKDQLKTLGHWGFDVLDPKLPGEEPPADDAASGPAKA